MKNKKWIILILFGLFIQVFFSCMDVKAYTPSLQETNCNMLGNKLDANSNVFVDITVKGSMWGNYFRCFETIDADRFVCYLSCVGEGWREGEHLFLDIFDVDPDTNCLHSILYEQKFEPVYGFNVIDFGESYQLNENNLYAFIISDNDELIDEGEHLICIIYMESYNLYSSISSSVFDNGIHGLSSHDKINKKIDSIYEPFDVFYFKSGKTVFLNGIMFFLIADVDNGIWYGNAYYKLDKSWEVSYWYAYKQTFHYEMNYIIDGISVYIGGDESYPCLNPTYSIYDGVRAELRYDSNDTFIASTILCQRNDLGNLLWERLFYGKFSSNVFLNKNYTYYLKLFSDYRDYVPNVIISVSDTPYDDCTYNREYGKLYMSNDNGSEWFEMPYQDLMFHLHVVAACPSSALTIYDNRENCSGDIVTSYLSSTGWKVWVNLMGNTTGIVWDDNHVNTTWSHVRRLLLNNSWLIFDNDTGNGTGGSCNFTVRLNLSGLIGYVNWTGDYMENATNITFYVTDDMSINGSVSVDEDEYFLSGVLSLDAASTILSLFAIFFYMGYKSEKRSGGWFMLFAGFLLIALGILVYGILGYAAAFVTPFAIFIMALGVKKGLYGPESTEKSAEKNTK